VRNAQDGISFIQTAEGALDEVSGMLNRMRDLAVQAKNGTQDSNSRAAIVAEYDQLQSAIGDIYSDTKFAGANVFSVFDGTGTDATTLATAVTNNDTNNAKSFQVGNSQGNTVTVDGGALTRLELTNLNFDDDVDPGAATTPATTPVAVATDTVGTTAATIATDANLLGNLDTAISMVSKARGTLGASQNRLESTVRNLSVTAENLSAAESRIRDVDVAEEMMSFTRSQILQQAGTAMLAQANGVSQGALQLLG